MKIVNYKEKLERIKNLSLGKQEEDLFKELSDLVDKYKKASIFRLVFDRSDSVRELREKINSAYKACGDTTGIFDDLVIYEDNMLNDIGSVETELANFEQENCSVPEAKRIDLIKQFSFGLGGTNYFENVIFNGTSYCVELVDRLCDILADEDLLSEISSIVSLCTSMINYDVLKNRLKRISDHKKTVEDNIELISEYFRLINEKTLSDNSIVFGIPFFEKQLKSTSGFLDEISSNKYKSEGDKLRISNLEKISKNLNNVISEKRKRVEQIKEKFEALGIDEIISGASQSDEVQYPIDNPITDISKIGIFFSDTENKYNYYYVCYEEAKEKLRDKMEKISHEAVELVEGNLFTCYNILDLSKKTNNFGIRKDHSLFALDVLLNLKEMTYDDFGVFTSSRLDREDSEFIEASSNKIEALCGRLDSELSAKLSDDKNDDYLLVKTSTDKD